MEEVQKHSYDRWEERGLQIEMTSALNEEALGLEPWRINSIYACEVEIASQAEEATETRRKEEYSMDVKYEPAFVWSQSIVLNIITNYNFKTSYS